MSDLIAPIVDGKIQTSTTTETEPTSTRGTTDLGKDAFLQLLVAQMQNQDPLAPTSDTEWISQLATYSSLEQMQNMSKTMTNTQAFSLIGQNVVVTTEDASGNTKYVSGTVDYVTVQSGVTYFSIDDTLYPAEDLYEVMDYDYLVKQCLPKVTAQTKEFDLNNPQDVAVTVDLGSDIAKATSVQVILNDAVVDASLVKLSGSTLTIAKSAFAGLAEGTYLPTLVFNDSFATSSLGDIAVNVVDSAEASAGAMA